MTDQFVWLIEASDPPHYWDGRSAESQTRHAHEAVRFSRFEDAERVRAWIVEGGLHWKSVEHGFPDPTASHRPADQPEGGDDG